MYEYAIVTDAELDIIHRGPMSEDEAQEWMLSLAERHRPMFRIMRRKVSPWEEVDINEISG